MACPRVSPSMCHLRAPWPVMITSEERLLRAPNEVRMETQITHLTRHAEKRDSINLESTETHLMIVGRIQRTSPSCAGSASKLPLGSSINIDSHTSPSTFANEVNTSANTTSEKYTRCGDGNKHLCTALYVGSERQHARIYTCSVATWNAYSIEESLTQGTCPAPA